MAFKILTSILSYQNIKRVILNLIIFKMLKKFVILSVGLQHECHLEYNTYNRTTAPILVIADICIQTRGI